MVSEPSFSQTGTLPTSYIDKAIRELKQFDVLKKKSALQEKENNELRSMLQLTEKQRDTYQALAENYQAESSGWQMQSEGLQVINADLKRSNQNLKFQNVLLKILVTGIAATGTYIAITR